MSTINALLAGYYDGQISIEKLKEYGDTGIGTFADLGGLLFVLHIFAYEKAAAARPSALLACRSSKTCAGQ